MNRVCSISKDQLSEFLKQGFTNRKIESITGVSRSQVSYLVRKYGLQDLYTKPKYDSFILNSINSKELAYMLGFIIADADINNEKVEISVQAADSEVMELFSSILGINSRTDNK